MKAIILRFDGKEEKKFWRLKLAKERLAKKLTRNITWEEFVYYNTFTFKRKNMTAQQLLEDSERHIERGHKPNGNTKNKK